MSLEAEVWEAGGRRGAWYLGRGLLGHVTLPGSHGALTCVRLRVLVGLSD